MLAGAGFACIVHGLFPGLSPRLQAAPSTRSAAVSGARFTIRRAGEEFGHADFYGLVALTIPAWGMLLMAPGYPLPALTALFALAIPAAYLWTNPQLEPID